MSLLSETSATVLEYNNLKASLIGLGNPTGIENGINFVKLKGKVDLTGVSVGTTKVLRDITTGQPLNVRGLLVWSTLMEANPMLVDSGVNPNLLYYSIVGIRESDGDYKVYDSGKVTQLINGKYMLIPYDDGVPGYQLLPNEYSTLGVLVDGGGPGTVFSGTVYVTFVGIRIPEY